MYLAVVKQPALGFKTPGRIVARASLLIHLRSGGQAIVSQLPVGGPAECRQPPGSLANEFALPGV